MEQKERGKGAPWLEIQMEDRVQWKRRGGARRIRHVDGKKIDYVTVDRNFSIGNEHTCLNSTSAPFFFRK